MNTLTAAALAAALLASAPAGADGMKMTMPTGASSAGGPKAPVDARYAKALSASTARMMTGMDVKSSGDPDRDFVLMMVPHHQGAIDMARIELQYGRDPGLRSLAASIIKAQEGEIATMKGWRAKAGR